MKTNITCPGGLLAYILQGMSMYQCRFTKAVCYMSLKMRKTLLVWTVWLYNVCLCEVLPARIWNLWFMHIILKCSFHCFSVFRSQCSGRGRTTTWQAKEAFRLRYSTWWPSWLSNKQEKEFQETFQGDSSSVDSRCLVGPLAPCSPRKIKAGHLSWIDNYRCKMS
jgi:hypothetical protein